MASLRDQILAADDLPRERVETPEWAPFGVPAVYVRGLTAREREVFEIEWGKKFEQNGKRKDVAVRATFVAAVVCDENGARVFTDDDIGALNDKSASMLQKLWIEGRRVSGMLTPDELEKMGGDDDDDAGDPSTGDPVESPSFA